MTETVPPAALTIEPAFQTVELTATQSAVPGVVRLRNTSDSDLLVTFAVLDFRQTGMDGSIAFIDKPVNPLEPLLASYISVKPETLLLTAHATQPVPFEITNSPSLTPGGHYAALVVKAQAVGESSTTTSIIPALSAQLLVRKVGGERFGVTVAPVQELPVVVFGLPKDVTLRFTNTGNTHVVPHGKVVLRDGWGTVLREASLNLGSVMVLPGSQRELSHRLETRHRAWPISWVTMTTQGSTNPGSSTFGTEVSAVFVAPYLLLFILVVFIGGGLVWWRARTNTFKKNSEK